MKEEKLEVRGYKGFGRKTLNT